MAENSNSNSWSEYSRLVLNELERLNENHERMRLDITSRFEEISRSFTEFRNTERQVQDQKAWMEKVNDVWSPTQMKEAKDEIYRQKTMLAAGIAIITFVQIIIGIGISIWSKLGH